jgi:hypothetical protein
MSRAARRAAFLAHAGALFDHLEAWSDAHPHATFAEIEAVARQQRPLLLGSTLALLINGRTTGRPVPAPACPACGAAMTFEGYRSRTIQGLEGATPLDRAYYVCAASCGQTLFPPG